MRQHFHSAARPGHGAAAGAGGAIRDRGEPLEDSKTATDGSFGTFTGGGAWRRRVRLRIARRARALAA